MTFLIPVVIDDTNDQDAEVPESFRAVQWSRLPAGTASPAFVERVSRLLSPEPAHAPAGVRSPAAAIPQTAAALRQPVSSLTTSGQARRVLLVIAAVVVIGVGYVALDKFVLSKRVAAPATPATQGGLPAPTAIPEKSIAVLPFVDMSEKKDQEYFADGLSEELIDHLSHSPDLKVIARTSSFQFKGKSEDVRTIAAKLGVANLLEGSVRKAGMELRITAQLIRASDGTHLWSQSYDRSLEDIFRVQDDIASTVADALHVALIVGNNPPENREPNTEAYNLLLQGKYFYYRNNHGDTERAIALYKQAITRDANFPLAWASLGRAYTFQWELGDVPATVARANALDAAQHALNIDPKLPSAHRLLGDIAQDDWNWHLAKSEYEKASAPGPEHLIAKADLAYLNGILSGSLGDSVRILRRQAELDPLDTSTLHGLAMALKTEGQLNASVAIWHKLLDLNPNASSAKAFLGETLRLMGHYPEALAVTKEETYDHARLPVLSCIYWTVGRRSESDAALAQFKTKFAKTDPYFIAGAYACRHERDALFEWLNQAYQAHQPYLSFVKLDPCLRDFHDDPRYKALLRKMNLPE